MPRRCILCIGVLYIGVLAAGCGAKVVFVGDDGQGGATAAAAGATGSTGAATGATAAISSTSGFMSPCERLCMEHPRCLGGADCVAECSALYVPGCEDETNAYVLCLAHNFGPGCELGPSCDGEFAVYENCFAPTPCVPGPCSSTEFTCQCTGECRGATILQDCEITDDFIICQCAADGAPLGECVQSILSCEIDPGCCKEVWLLAGGGAG